VHYISTGKFPIEDKNLHFHKLPIFFRKSFFFHGLLFILMAYIAYESLKYKVESLIAFGPMYAFACLPAKVLCGTKLITFLRGDWVKEITFKTKNPLVIKCCELVEKISFLHSDIVCTVTNDLKESKQSMYGIEGIKVLYNNINAKEFHPRNSRNTILKEFKLHRDCFLVGFVGPFLPIKRIDVLINSFAKVSDKSTVLIVGSGECESELRALVSLNHIDSKVIFTGWRNDIPEIMSSLDLLVLPSEYEGCPQVLLEALACETLCIGSNVGGIKEVLYYDDLLFEPLNVEELERKLERIKTDKEYYDRIKALCLDRRSKFIFDWEKKIVETIRS